MSISEFLFRWDKVPIPPDFLFTPAKEIELDDETLRDGMQAPGIAQLQTSQQVELLRIMDELGIHTADIGLPANPKSAKLIEALAVASRKLRIAINVACRTIVGDIAPVASLQQHVGKPVEVYAFLGSSEIRRIAENWDWQEKEQCVRKAIQFAVRENIPFAFVTEDTTRAQPETLEKLFRVALEEGAKRLVICDTCGATTPTGVRALFCWTKRFLESNGFTGIALDWHGHNDRGLALANALEAAQCGFNRIHATGLGVGERAGNTAMDLVLANLALEGFYDPSRLSLLTRYVEIIAKGTGRSTAVDYPVLGDEVFSTATGVHAAAVCKALNQGNPELANLVYSSVPASWVGREQRIEVGPMSGAWNVRFMCQELGIAENERIVNNVLKLAQVAGRTLTHDEIRRAAEEALG